MIQYVSKWVHEWPYIKCSVISWIGSSNQWMMKIITTSIYRTIPSLRVGRQHEESMEERRRGVVLAADVLDSGHSRSVELRTVENVMEDSYLTIFHECYYCSSSS